MFFLGFFAGVVTISLAAVIALCCIDDPSDYDLDLTTPNELRKSNDDSDDTHFGS